MGPEKNNVTYVVPTSTDSGWIFKIVGNPEMMGCGGDGCNDDCFVDEEEWKQIRNDFGTKMLERREEIFKKACVGPWAGEPQKELYAFSSDDIQELDGIVCALYEECNIAYDQFDAVFQEFMEASTISPVRILRSGDAMIVFWDDGDKTVVKRAPDEKDSDYIAFTAALGKKMYGSNSKLARMIKKLIEYQTPKKPKKDEHGFDVNELLDIPKVFNYDDAKWTSSTTSIYKDEENNETDAD